MPEPEGPSSRRLIIPGSESEPEPTSTPRIVLPGGEDAASEPAEGEAEPEVPRGKSRIILPPGVAPAVEDVPEFPKLQAADPDAVRRRHSASCCWCRTRSV